MPLLSHTEQTIRCYVTHIINDVNINGSLKDEFSSVELPLTIETGPLSICDIQFNEDAVLLVRSNTALTVTQEITDKRYVNVKITLLHGNILLSKTGEGINNINIVTSRINALLNHGEVLFRLSKKLKHTIICKKGMMGLRFEDTVKYISSSSKIIVSKNGKLSETKKITDIDAVWLSDLNDIVYYSDNELNDPSNIKITKHNQPSDSNIDVLLFIDTSGSMGPDENNVFRTIQREIYGLLNLIPYGTQLSLISFDSMITEHYTDYILSKADKYKIYEIISKLKPGGKHTNMTLMLDELLHRATFFENAHPERQIIAYILSDGKDDTPKDVRKLKDNLVRLANELKKRDWFIHLLDLSNKKRPNDDPESTELIDINRLYGEIFRLVDVKGKKLIDPLQEIISLGKKKAKVKLEEMKSKSETIVINEAEDENKQSFWDYIFDNFRPEYLLIPLGIFLLLIAGRFTAYIRQKQNVTVSGTLVYYSKDMSYSKKQEIVLSNYNRKTISLGRDITNDIVIDRAKWKGSLYITAQYINGKVFYNAYDDNKQLWFINRRYYNRLSYGDSFEIANYIFNFQSPKIIEDN